MKLLSLFGSSLLVFTVSYLLMRIMGKRAVAQMSSFDLMVMYLLGAMLATPLSVEGTMVRTLLSAVFLVLVYLGFSYLMLNRTARKVLLQKPTIIVSKGKINETGLRHMRMTVPELLGQLRVKGYASLADVEFAIMESEGSLSVIPKSDKAPVTPYDLKLVTPTASLTMPVIVEGQWEEDNLSALRKNRQWVQQMLKMHKINPEEVNKLSLVQVETDGSLIIDKNELAEPKQK